MRQILLSVKKMILINNLKLPLDTDFTGLACVVADYLKINESSIKDVELYKKSVDARRKSDVHFCCSVLVEVTNGQEAIVKKNKNAQIFSKEKYVWKTAALIPKLRPVIVGFGPAGMFCALTLARAGLRPIVLERGSEVDKRTKQVAEFLNGGALNTESNVQFGEGGAGTFSDGKLNTGIKNIRCREVLETFVQHGAPKKILVEAKPHIGTDILVSVVKSIRNEIISLGGEVLFDTRLESIETQNENVAAVTASSRIFECESLVLATGHSARDVFEMLLGMGVALVRKPFSMGVRIEHLQSDINRALYGKFADHPALSAADYKLAVHLENGRGVYSFCMCPGGEVINSSSEEGGIAVNGMSKSARDGKNANSALLVNVEPSDLEGNDVLAGCMLQRKIEQRAYSLCTGAVPVTTVGEFVFGKEFEITKVKPTVKPQYCYADISQIFPEFITESLKTAIKLFDNKIHGFADSASVITAPETRSSSPVRVVRNDKYQSKSISGLYPCGEGAGYAGGIVSAAVDGMTVAEKIIEKYQETL